MTKMRAGGPPPTNTTTHFLPEFSHVNLSGVGCPELGSLLLMPTSGELNVDYKQYGSEYALEEAHPGYYANRLTRYGIDTEVSATPAPPSPDSPTQAVKATYCSI